MTFGNYLKKLREERELSLRVMSLLSKVNYTYINRLERGEKTKPSEPVLKSLAKALRLKDRRLGVFMILGKWIEMPDSLFHLSFREGSDLTLDLIEIGMTLKSRGAHPRTEKEWLITLSEIKKYL